MDDRLPIVRQLAQEIAREAADRILQIIREEFTQPSDDSTTIVESDRLIFINYRRADSEDVCGRIYDRLTATFGSDGVFRDVANIPPGSDFRVILEREVAVCDLMLVIMGREWFSSENEQRLSEVDDFVRFEIETALKRNIPIIPLWVGRRTTMPDANRLPESIRDLTNRQSISVRADPDFHADVDRLIARIVDIFDLLNELKNPPHS